MAFAALLNQEARALAADGVDVIQFDEPAFNVYMDAVGGMGRGGAGACGRGARVQDRGAHLLRLRHPGEHRLEGHARRRVAAVRGDFPGAGGKRYRPGLARVRQLARAVGADAAARRQGRAGRRDRRGDRSGGDAGGGRRRPSPRRCPSCRPSGCSPAPIAAWRRCAATWRRRSWRHSARGPPWRGGGLGRRLRATARRGGR